MTERDARKKEAKLTRFGKTRWGDGLKGKKAGSSESSNCRLEEVDVVQGTPNWETVTGKLSWPVSHHQQPCRPANTVPIRAITLPLMSSLALLNFQACHTSFPENVHCHFTRTKTPMQVFQGFKAELGHCSPRQSSCWRERCRKDDKGVALDPGPVLEAPKEKPLTKSLLRWFESGL